MQYPRTSFDLLWAQSRGIAPFPTDRAFADFESGFVRSQTLFRALIGRLMLVIEEGRDAKRARDRRVTSVGAIRILDRRASERFEWVCRPAPVLRQVTTAAAGAVRRQLLKLALESVPNPLEGYDGRDSPSGSVRLAMCGRMH